MTSNELPELVDPQEPQGPPRPKTAPTVEMLHKQQLGFLIKRRADQLQIPRIYDDGEVAIPGVQDPKEAQQTAMRSYLNLMRMDPEFRRQAQNFVLGKSEKIPDNWDVDDSIVPSSATMRQRGIVADVKAAREAEPIKTAIADYALGPARRLTTGALQASFDIGVGILNLAGADLKAPNIRALTTAHAKGMSEEEVLLRTAAMDAAASGPARFIGEAADIGGLVAGLGGGSGLVGLAPKLAMKPGAAVAGAAAKGVTTTIGKVGGKAAVSPATMAMGAGAKKVGEVVEGMARGAGAFAGYEAVVARGEGDTKPTGEERLEALGHGAVAGAAMGLAGVVSKSMLRHLFRSNAKQVSLDPVDGQMMEALKGFAKKHNIIPVKHQSLEAYGDRIIDSWIEAGMPGAPKMPIRRLFGHAIRGGVEGTGFSLLDLQFREDLIDAVRTGNTENLGRMVETIGKNSLGLLASRVPLGSIPGFQRSTPTPRATTPEAKPQEAPPVEGVAAPARPRAEAKPQEGGIPEAGVTMMEGEVRQQVDPATLKVPPEPKRDRATGTVMDGPTPLADLMWRDVFPGETIDPDMARFGWRAEKPPETPPEPEGGVPAKLKPKEPRGGGGAAAAPEAAREPGVKVTLPGTDYSYEVRPSGITPNPKLAKLLSIEGEVDKDAFHKLLGKVSMLSELDATTLLPGTKISANPTIVAVPGSGSEKGVMRKISLGEVLESPLGPEPKWKSAETIPARGQDAVDPLQQQAVEMLTHILNNHRGLPQADIITLSKSIDVLKSVSARNDQAVAETMEVLPNLLAGMSAGNPEHTGRLIKALSEMLTTKSPEVAIEDMTREMETQLIVRETRKRLRAERDASDNPDVGSRGNVMKHVLDIIREREGEPDIVTPKAQAYLRSTLEMFDRGDLSAEDVGARVLTEQGILFPESVTKAARTHYDVISKFADVKAEVTPQQEIAAERLIAATRSVLGKPREGEGGFIDVEAAGKAFVQAGEAIERAVRSVLKMPVRALGTVLSLGGNSPWVRGFAVGQIEKTREREPVIGERGFAAEANTREYETEFDPLVAQMPKGRVPSLEVMTWSEPMESGVKHGFEASHIAKETDLQQKFEIDPASYGPEAQAALKPWNKLTRLIREKASELKMHVQGLWTPEGELAEISRDAKKDVMTRQGTPMLQDAMMRGSGKVFDGIVESLADVNGMSKEKVKEIFAEDGWTDARSLKRRDAVEHMRRFKFFPDHLQFADGSVVRLLETNPLRHAKRMARGAAMRLGVVKEFGPDDLLTQEQLAQKKAGYTSDLPTPYRAVVESAKGENRELVATMMRSLMGMPTNKLPDSVEIGGGWHKLRLLLDGLNSLDAAAHMTFGSPLQNIIEPFATGSAMLGADRIGRNYGEVAQAIGEGRIKELLEERQQRGGFALHAPEFMRGGEQGLMENALTWMRTGQSAALMPFEFTQGIADVVIHKALHEAVDGWRKGDSQKGDAEALQTLFGFSTAHAQQVVEGKAPPQAYRQIELNGLSRLTRRGDLPANKSDFARSRNPILNAIKYTGFFQAQTAKLRRSVLQMRDAETGEQQARAAANFGKLVGFNLGAFMAGQSLIKLVSGGWDELMGFWGETIEESSTPGGAAKLAATALVGSFFGGAGSLVGGGLYSLVAGGKEEKGEVIETLSHMVPVVGSAINMAEFANATWSNVTGQPLGGDSPYAGKSPLQQVGYLVGREVPLAKWVENGPLGLGITYLGTDPQLEGALKAARRIDDKLGVEDDFPTNPDAAFVDAMRAAVTKLRAKEDDIDISDIAAAIREAVPEKDDSAVASSLLVRRQLTGERWDKLSDEQKESKLRSLGENRVELLRGYDAVLERAASHFQPLSSRRRRRR